jgi:hypothetical protein
MRPPSRFAGLFILACVCFVASTAVTVTAVTLRQPFFTFVCVPLVALGVVVMGRAVRARGKASLPG